MTLEHPGFAAYIITKKLGTMTPRKSLGLGFVEEIQTFTSVVCIYSIVTSGVIYEHKKVSSTVSPGLPFRVLRFSANLYKFDIIHFTGVYCPYGRSWVPFL